MATARVELGQRSQEQRDAILKGITKVLVINHAKPENVEVLLCDTVMQCWGKGGKTSARRVEEQSLGLYQ